MVQLIQEHTMLISNQKKKTLQYKMVLLMDQRLKIMLKLTICTLPLKIYILKISIIKLVDGKEYLPFHNLF